MAIYTLGLHGIIAIIVGAIILIWPKSLNIVIGLYLLIIGILQILNGVI